MEPGDGRSRVAQVLESTRTNALLSWLLTAFVGVVVVQNVLAGRLLWAGFAASVAVLALVPPLAHRDPVVMLPWEVLVLGALPLLGRALATAVLTTQVATYLAVAALALVVAVELDVFTSVRMTTWFAVLFVVISTMAAAGVWAVVQWLSDIYLGTAFVVKPGLTPEEMDALVMWDFVAATAAGVLAGVVFEGYFRRRARGKERLPEAVQEVVE